MMTKIEIGLVVVAGATAVFALAGGILAALERTPGLREDTSVVGSPSRALAVPEIVGGIALLGFSIALWVVQHEPKGLMSAAASVGLLVHAGSAFARNGTARRRAGKVGLWFFALSMVVGAYLFRGH